MLLLLAIALPDCAMLMLSYQSSSFSRHHQSLLLLCDILCWVIRLCLTNTFVLWPHLWYPARDMTHEPFGSEDGWTFTLWRTQLQLGGMVLDILGLETEACGRMLTRRIRVSGCPTRSRMLCRDLWVVWVVRQTRSHSLLRSVVVRKCNFGL